MRLWPVVWDDVTIHPNVRGHEFVALDVRAFPFDEEFKALVHLTPESFLNASRA